MARRAPTSAKERHRHGCIRCHTWYEDACKVPETDGYCFPCRTGKPGFKEIYQGRQPRACCLNARPANKEDITRYDLRGHGPWWLCGTCHRTFPHVKPKEKK